MWNKFFVALDQISTFIWTFPALILIVGCGLWMTLRSRFFQVRRFPAIVGTFKSFLRAEEYGKRGVGPLKAFFASLGGTIGPGNIIVACIAVQIGGPGALFWVWITGFFGMLLKYTEVNLGMRYRIKNRANSYDGGPMYFLPPAYGVKWVAYLVAFLLCIYGTEVFVFSELTEMLSTNWDLNRVAVAAILLALVIGAGVGGVRIVGDISSAMIPLFVVLYLAMSLYVLAVNVTEIPRMLATVFKSAFTGYAPVGAFAGSTWWMAMAQGAARGSYSGDLGIGYASVIHSESSTLRPNRQAALAAFGVLLDTILICSMTLALILVTGVWSEPLPSGILVQTALGKYFPYMQFFMPFFLLLLGYSTLAAYFCFGLKCAKFLSPRFGKPIYVVYGIIALALFSAFEPTQPLIIMTLCGGLLIVFNVTGMFLLRKEVSFDLEWRLSESEPQES